MMNFFKKKTILLLLAAPLALGSASALAAGHGDSNNMYDKSMHSQKAHGSKKFDKKCQPNNIERKAWKKLELTDAQKTQLKDIRKQSRQEMMALKNTQRDMIKAGKDQLDSLVMANKFDEAAVRGQLQKMVDSKQEARKNMNMERKVLREKQRNAMYNVLTAEQKQKFKELREERAQKCIEKQKKREERKDARAKQRLEQQKAK